jgi:hypothetical protein
MIRCNFFVKTHGRRLPAQNTDAKSLSWVAVRGLRRTGIAATAAAAVLAVAAGIASARPVGGAASCAPDTNHIWCKGTATLRVGTKTAHYTDVECFTSRKTHVLAEVWKPTKFVLTMSFSGKKRKTTVVQFIGKDPKGRPAIARTAIAVTLNANRTSGHVKGRTDFGGYGVVGSFTCK